MPKSTVGSRSFSTEPIPDGVRVRDQDLIEAILSSDNEQQPISLDDGAQEVLETLFNEVEGRLKGDLAEMTDLVLHGYVHTAALSSIGKNQTSDLDGPTQVGSFSWNGL